jgi:hypothetical protein
VDDARSFRPGALGCYDSVKGFAVIGSDGRAGRVSWGSYASGKSYLVVTEGRLRRKHRVLPAAAVASVSDGKVYVDLSRSQLRELPLLSHPEAVVSDQTHEQTMNAVARAYAQASLPRYSRLELGIPRLRDIEILRLTQPRGRDRTVFVQGSADREAIVAEQPHHHQPSESDQEDEDGQRHESHGKIVVQHVVGPSLALRSTLGSP